MAVYLLTIVTLLALAALELTVAMSVMSRRVLYTAAYFLLVMQIGLRWETGTDWNNYLTHFESITSLSTATPTVVSPEYGYNWFVWLMKQFTLNYSVFLTIHALVFYYLVCNSIRTNTGMLFLPLMVFYGATMGFMGSNRQLIALALGLYSLRFVIEKKRGKYLLCIAVACLFHYSAIILLIFLLLDRQLKPITILALISCAIAIGLSPLPAVAFSGTATLIGAGEAYKAAYYLALTHGLPDSGLSPLGLVRRLALLAIFVYNRKTLSEQLRSYNLMLNGYIAGVMLYFLFAQSLLVMVSRGTMYFEALEPVLLASQVLVFRRRSNRIVLGSVLCALSVVFMFESIATYPDLFVPYKGMGINSGYSRMMR